MSENIIRRKWIFRIIGFEILIYISFLTIDIFFPYYFMIGTIIKYIGIIICFIITFIFGRKPITKDLWLLRIGMLFTIFADLFLLILYYPKTGIIIFSLVQVIYIFRYNEKNNRESMYCIGGYIVIYMLICTIINKLTNELDLLSVLAFFYFTLILYNTVFSFIKLKKLKTKKQGLIAIGMFLFLLCDINVGIYNIGGNFTYPILIAIYKFSEVGMWLFYLPSQMLLSCSGIVD